MQGGVEGEGPQSGSSGQTHIYCKAMALMRLKFPQDFIDGSLEEIALQPLKPFKCVASKTSQTFRAAVFVN